jgi:RNA polymerase sigma factor (sigma-70 family)
MKVGPPKKAFTGANRSYKINSQHDAVSETGFLKGKANMAVLGNDYLDASGYEAWIEKIATGATNSIRLPENWSAQQKADFKQDAKQEASIACIRAARHWYDRGQETGVVEKADGYVFVSARNAISKFLQRHLFDSSHFSDSLDGNKVASDHEDGEYAPREAIRLDKQRRSTDAAAAEIRECLDKIPAKIADIIRQSLQNFTPSEIAEKIGCSRQYTNRQLARGERLLKNLMNPGQN